MVKVRGNTDLMREEEEISDVASYLLDRLRLMEGGQPFLKDAYPEYIGLRKRIEQAVINPPENKTALGVLFDELRECLHRISDEINAQITARGQSIGLLIPPNYLPISFDLLLEEFAESSLHQGIISPVDDVTEDLLFGDMGIEEIAKEQRDRIRKKVLKALVCNYGKAREIRNNLNEYGEKVFELLKLSSDKLKALRAEQEVEPLKAAVALIILNTRAQISHKRRMRMEAPLYRA